LATARGAGDPDLLSALREPPVEIVRAHLLETFEEMGARCDAIDR